jgi:membrane protein
MVASGDGPRQEVGTSSAAPGRLSTVADLLRRVVEQQGSERIGLAASGAAFWLVICAFPTAVAVISLFGLVEPPDRVAQDVTRLTVAGQPDAFASVVARQLNHVANTAPSGLSVAFAVAVVLALWSASSGVYNLVRAMRAAYGLAPGHYVSARLRAFVGGIVVVAVLGSLALALPLLSKAGSRVPKAAELGIEVIGFLVVLTALIMAIYRFSIGRPAGFWGLLPGAACSTLAVCGVLIGLAAYVHFSGRLTAVYGILAGGVIVMTATYLVVYVLLIGAVLNVQLAVTPLRLRSGSDGRVVGPAP